MVSVADRRGTWNDHRRAPGFSASWVGRFDNCDVSIFRNAVSPVTYQTINRSYQCSFQTYDRAGYSHEAAVELMKCGVKLAVEAREIYLKEVGGSHERKIKIALSLGPFGASLSPAQEFDGFYPPPYGPKEYSPDGQNSNAYLEEQVQEELEAENMLKLFHLERLKVFAEDDLIWQGVDMLAFETVPLARETRAIRRAIGSLDGFAPKPWWISTVWPGGTFPQGNKSGSGRLAVRDVFDALFGEVTEYNPAPQGFGVNCTTIENMKAVVTEMGKNVNVHQSPFLVIYPNGGDVYDIIERRWVTTAGPDSPKAWASSLAEFVESQLRCGTWSRILVGGCCRTYPEHIQILSNKVRRT